jgi:hypothetical protein
MRSTLKRCLLFATPAMVTTVFLFQNCGPAQVNVGGDSADLASQAAPTVGVKVDLTALLKSPQEPASNILFPSSSAALIYDYSNFAPIIETVVFKRNTFDRIEWIHGPSSTVVANGDSFNKKQFSHDLLGTYYIFGYRGPTPYLVKEFQIVEKTKPSSAADSANAVTVTQSQVETDATTETVLVTAEAPDVDLNTVTFLQKNTNTSTNDKRAILITKKLSESFDVAITVSDLSGNSMTKTITLTSKSCDFNGNTVLNGSSATAYLTSSVPYGQTCTSQSRVCSSGSLSGTYTNANCTVNPPANCSFNGASVVHGASVVAYQTTNVPYGQTCASQSRTCNNGVLSGTYANSSCSPLPPAACSLDGKTIASGASIAAYLTTTVPYGQTCTSQTRTCSNGSLSGSNPYASCSVLPGINIMQPMAPLNVTVIRGAKFSFTLLVTQLKATPTALLGFAHLVPNGSTVSSLSVDFEPTTPSNVWSTNSSIAASLSMTVPATLAPGTYTIRAGFYERASPFSRYKLDAAPGVTEDGLVRYMVGTVTVK